MLVCGKKDVYHYLDRGKLKKIYLTKNFDDKNILNLIDEVNKDEEVVEIKYVKRDELDKMTDEKHEDIIGEKSSSFIVILMLIIALIFLIFVSVGIAFSLYDVVNKDIPSVDTPTGNIILNYSDTNGQGNGIHIENAYAIPDSQGMNLIGNKDYFDFTVSGSTSNIPLDYYILIQKQNSSTLDDSIVKIYLTKLNGTLEEKIDNPHLINSLDNKEMNGVVNKVLYKRNLDESANNFVDNYRLRIWIDENAQDYYNKSYSIIVNVYGEGR